MENIRVIARLDIKGPNLVKGIHLEGLRVLGKPEDFANYYYENGADELFYQDVVASLYERNSLHDIISKTAKQTFIPLTVGGGIRSLGHGDVPVRDIGGLRGRRTPPGAWRWTLDDKESRGPPCSVKTDVTATAAPKSSRPPPS